MKAFNLGVTLLEQVTAGNSAVIVNAMLLEPDAQNLKSFALLARMAIKEG